MIDIAHIIEKTRYIEGGRSWPDVDCYGIVLYVRELLGLKQLPELGHARRNKNMDEIGRAQVAELIKCAPENGAIAACYDGAGLMIHTGVFINGAVLECNPKRHASISPAHRFIKRFHKVEFFK